MSESNPDIAAFSPEAQQILSDRTDHEVRNLVRRVWEAVEFLSTTKFPRTAQEVADILLFPDRASSSREPIWSNGSGGLEVRPDIFGKGLAYGFLSPSDTAQVVSVLRDLVALSSLSYYKDTPFIGIIRSFISGLTTKRIESLDRRGYVIIDDHSLHMLSYVLGYMANELQDHGEHDIIVEQMRTLAKSIDKIETTT